MPLRHWMIGPLAAAALWAIAAAGCGGGDSPGAAPQGGSAGSGIPNSPPEIEVPEGLPPKRLVVKDLQEGTGMEARKGDAVRLHYYGIGWGSGLEHANSWDYEGIPTFDLTDEERQLLRGLKLAVPGMREGGGREVIVPHTLLSYPGENRSTGRLDALIYKVYLVEVLRKKDA